MINISKNGNAIKFAFTDSDHYLYGSGEIEVPVNSLSLIVDGSNMVTMKKANSNDIFLSFDPANSNLSDKAGVIDFYKTQMVGSTGGSESGITSGDVETIIDAALADYYTDDEVDAALSGKADASDVTEEISAAVSGKADTTAVTEEISAAVSGLAPESAVTALDSILTAHTADTGIHVSQEEKDGWNAKLDASAYTPTDLSEYYTKGQTDGLLDEKLDASAYTPTDLSNYYTKQETNGVVDGAVSGKADTSAVTAVENEITVLGNALAGKANTSALTAHTADTGIHVSAQEKNAWNAKAEPYSAGTGIEISGNVISATGGGGVLVINLDDLTNNMTDAKWDELANALENDIPIFSVIDASGEDTTDIQQFPVNGMLIIDENEGTSEITLNQLFGGGYYEIHIQKNGSEDYTITNDWHFVPNELSAGTGIDITDNVISCTVSGGSVTVDSELDMNSSNPVENQAIAAPIEDIYNALDGSYNDGTLMVKLKRISQSDYDDLVNMGTTDSDTLYIITPDEENEGGE